jgi:hypothetical protein
MKRKLLILALLLTGCAAPITAVAPPTTVFSSGLSVWHDDVRGATCYQHEVPYGLSCVGDKELVHP